MTEESQLSFIFMRFFAFAQNDILFCHPECNEGSTLSFVL